MSKQAEVTIERRRASIVAWCPGCNREITQITAEGAAWFCAVSTRSIYQAIEDGSIHWTENADGFLWLCIESLVKKGWRECKQRPWF
jgi:hypothetical protein